MSHNDVKLIECPRDAWQGLKQQIPTTLKARYLQGLIDAGFTHIDAVSFVSPKAVPQMADSEKVLEQLRLQENVEIIGIVVNEKGADRAVATHAVTTLGYPCSISETFLRNNQNQTLDDSFKMLESIKRNAEAAKLAVLVSLVQVIENAPGLNRAAKAANQDDGDLAAVMFRSGPHVGKEQDARVVENGSFAFLHRTEFRRQVGSLGDIILSNSLVAIG